MPVLSKKIKAIFISDKSWLAVFNLLEPSQLGLGIALISHQFDSYVDEHFKTRKWTLKFMRICSKVGENGTKEMEIANCHGEPLPIPQVQMPHNVIGFELILISFIDRNVIAFLHRFCPLPIKMSINAINGHILAFIFQMIAKNICGFRLSFDVFRRLRQSVPSILNDRPSLRVVNLYATLGSANDFFTEFPADDSAAASDGQAVAKWLFTPRPDDVPKVFQCWLNRDDGHLASKIAALKAAFASACSPVNFIISVWFASSFASSVVPFALTNELTREQLALKRTFNSHRFLFVRCPIGRDESKWTKWEEEAIDWQIYNQWNQIHIDIYGEDQIGDGLLDTTPGPSDQQK